ncbi:hypothetical protein, partial [Streptomyces angustmyceticus]|uniref:hypothetical protein n=1 Tax=Streptomyces angustmyceticus TaxID=285578 RepID=UPI001ABFFEBA
MLRPAYCGFEFVELGPDRVGVDGPARGLGLPVGHRSGHGEGRASYPPSQRAAGRCDGGYEA